MASSAEWIYNSRPVRLASLAIISFVTVAVAGGLLLVPTLGLSPAWTWAGVGVISAIAVVAMSRAQPLMIKVSSSAIHARYLFSWKVVPTSDVERFLFLIDKKHLRLEWARRYYSLHLRLATGRRIVLGGIDGPVMQKVAAQIPQNAARVQIYSGRRLVEERGLETL